MAEVNPPTGADPEVLKALKKYVIRSCPSILNGDAKTLEAAVSTKETEEIFRIFATDAQISALIVQKKLKRPLKPDEDPTLGLPMSFLTLFHSPLSPTTPNIHTT